MSITARQSELFAGEVWTTMYAAFTQINFNATDPVSINQALRNYIQTNYPEQYNDWIISSEFIAIIDLLSWLAGTLAFKTDIAARENFIDTAESRESLLRLARFLSYNPSRCSPATGIIKITQIMTNDDVLDDFGIDLINTPIIWNDPNNSNWFEQFTAILNAAFVGTNPFGVPINEGTVSGISTQTYRLNGQASLSNLGFSSTVSGIGMDFEVCNGDFNDGGTLFERPPNPQNAFQFYYLNDGRGNASSRTGFFMLFKQGTTQNQTFNIAVPVENQLIDINSINVNNTDVWVNTVDDNGNVQIAWTLVPAIFNSNITYNNIPVDQRNIFAVITRDNDQITLRFSDGRFGNAPTGLIQCVYRVSNGLTYAINPSEIDNIQIPFKYLNANGSQKILYITFSLMETVSNASAAETIEQIRQRAPQVYGTQGRMVSGEDYNTFPLSTNLAVKIQAINRVYSGQSRYIDLFDPTGFYQDLSIFAEDGIFFKENTSNYFEISSVLNLTNSQIISNYIQPTLTQYTIPNIIRDVLLQNVYNGTIHVPPLVWTTSSASLFQTTGWFSSTNNLIQPGAMIQFNIAGTPTWVAVIDIEGPINTVPPVNTAGPVTLSEEVPTGSTIIYVIPSATVEPSATVLSTIQTQLNLKLSFSLWYDYNPTSNVGSIWVVNPAANDFGEPDPELIGTQLQIMNVNYTSGLWQITARGLRYVFESVSEVQWYDNGRRSLAQYTGEAMPDIVRILKINENLNNIAGFGLPVNYNLMIDRLWLYPDGTAEPRRTVVLFSDTNQDGYPDRPDTFYQVTTNGYPFNLSVSALSGSTTFTFANANGIIVGDLLVGYGIQSGTVITAVNYTTGVITFNLTTNQNLGIGATVYVRHPLDRGVLEHDPNSYLFWSNAANPPYVEPLYTVKAYDTDILRQADTPAAGTVGFQAISTVTGSIPVVILLSTVGISTGATLLFSDTTGVAIGQIATGVGITPGSTVIAFGSNFVTFDRVFNGTVSVGEPISFFANTSYLDDETFWVYDGTQWNQDLNGIYSFELGRGPNVAASWTTATGTATPSGDEIIFHWKHFANSEHRIDPACTNIIDIYVLTFSYDTAVRNWIANGAIPADLPTPPTELDLSISFQSLAQYQMF